MNTLIARSVRPYNLPRASILVQLQHNTPSAAVQHRSPPSNRSTSLRSYTTETTSPTLTTEKPRNNRVNPPASTLPPPLTIPPKDPTKSLFKSLFQQGKAYLTFYKTGAQAVFTNLSLARTPQQLVDQSYNGAVHAAVADRRLTRADYQLLLRSWHDIKRVPVFGLIFLVCGEFTPFVVVALSAVVPYTCRVPAQITADRRKLEERRKASFRNPPAPYVAGAELDRAQLRHITHSLGLASRLWDYAGGAQPGLPTRMLRARVAQRVEYVETDDRLIRRDGGVQDLEAEEVLMACVERGLDVLGRSEEDAREALGKWVVASKTTAVERLLLTRPNAWPVVPAKKN